MMPGCTMVLLVAHGAFVGSIFNFSLRESPVGLSPLVQFALCTLQVQEP